MKHSIVATSLLLTSVVPAQTFVRSCPFVTPGGLPVGIDATLTGELLFTELGTPQLWGTTDAACNILSTNNITANNANPLGITQDINGNYYITDTGGDEVDIFDNTGTYVSSFPVMSTFPEGIAYSIQSNNLYVVDGTGGNQCLEYDLAGTLLNQYPLNGTSNDGIAHDFVTDTFWVYDSGTDSIRNYDNAFVELSSMPGTRAAGFGNGEGLAMFGTTLWVVATGTDTLVEFAIGGTPATATPYGMGCPSGAGPLTLSAITRPITNSTFVMQTDNISPTATAGAVLIMARRASVPLGPVGFPAGCSLLVDRSLGGATLPISLMTGATSWSIPVDMNAIGLSLALQSAVIAPGLGTPITVALSNGLELSIGDS